MKNTWLGIALFGLLILWAKGRTIAKYRVGDQLTQAGDGVFTIDGVWDVNGVFSYIMEGPEIIGNAAYPVNVIDNSTDWIKVA
jgi:hypothetical protein